jgi:hypothetical protein
MVDLDNCKKQGCEMKANNDQCDTECNLFACQFVGKIIFIFLLFNLKKGGECSTHQINPFEKCPHNYCSHSFSNGKCDQLYLILN